MSIVNRKILLTGKNGQVGWELQRTLATLGEVIALGREGMDLADPDSIRRAIRDVKPDIIVNAAAYTAVDKAESEPELAMAINGVAPGIMAEEAKKFGAAIIHYSTDYVFDGTKPTPYTEDDTPNPINAYGKSKLAGEQAIQAVGAPHLIFRTSWVYGLRGQNFLRTIMPLAKEREELRVVDDQFGAPTWSRLIAQGTAQVIGSCIGRGDHQAMVPAIRDLSGLYNLTCRGHTSWCGFARAIVDGQSNSANVAKEEPFCLARVIPITSAEYPSPAQRPRNSLLLCDRITEFFGWMMPSWDVALNLALSESRDE